MSNIQKDFSKQTNEAIKNGTLETLIALVPIVATGVSSVVVQILKNKK